MCVYGVFFESFYRCLSWINVKMAHKPATVAAINIVLICLNLFSVGQEGRIVLAFGFFDQFAVVEGFFILQAILLVVAQPGAVLLSTCEMADLPELAGLAVKPPFTFHDIVNRPPFGLDLTVLEEVCESVALLLVCLLPVGVLLFIHHRVGVLWSFILVIQVQSFPVYVVSRSTKQIGLPNGSRA